MTSNRDLFQDSHSSLAFQRHEQLRHIDRVCDQFETEIEKDSNLELSLFLKNNANDASDELVAELIAIDLQREFAQRTDFDIDMYSQSLGQYESLARHRYAKQRDYAAFENFDLQFGDKVYQIEEKIGAGGMAEIFRGYDKRLQRWVAIKKLRADLACSSEAVEHFKNEARLMAAIRHDGIVKVLDVGIHKDELFLVFELIEGGTLKDLIGGKPVDPYQAAKHAHAIAEAIEEAHGLGIIHLDLKPSNVLVTPGGKLKVADFGLATLQNNTAIDYHNDGCLSGTLQYMAPEQTGGRRDQLDERTDVYGIGSILYQMLTGQAPLLGQTRLELTEQINKVDPPRPRSLNQKIPADLESICLKCLQKNPADRYSSAKSLAEDLQAFLDHRPTLANPVGWVGRGLKWCHRQRAVVATLLIAAIVVIAITVTYILGLINERNRFRVQRDLANANLYDSLVGEAQAIRLASANGYRKVALEKIRQAIELNTPNLDREQLRDEVVAGMLNGFVGQDPVTWTPPGKDMFVANAIHPDSKQMAVGLYSGRIEIRSIPTGHVRQTINGHRAGVFEIVFSSDGKRMASADDSGEIRIWQMENDNWVEYRKINCPEPARKNYVKTISLAFADQGTQLLFCPFAGTQVQRWSIDDEQVPVETEYFALSPIVRFSLSPDESLLAIGDADNNVTAWDRKEKSIHHVFDLKNKQQLLDVVFSNDQRFIGVGTLNGARVLDLDSKKYLYALPGDHLITLAFNPLRHALALPSEDLNLVRIWDVSANRILAVLNSDAFEALYSRDGNWLVCSAASQISIWNMRSCPGRQELSTHQGGVAKILFDERFGFFYTSSSKRQYRYDSNTSTMLGQTETGQRLLCGNNGLAAMIDNQKVNLVQLNDGGFGEIVDSSDHQLGINISNGVIDDQANFLLVSGIGGVQRWKIHRNKDASGKQNAVLQDRQKLFRGRAINICVSSDSKRICWSDEQGAVFCWDNTTDELLRSEHQLTANPGGMDFIAGTHNLVLADVNGNIVNYNLDTDTIENEIHFPVVPGLDNQWLQTRVAVDPSGQKICIQRGAIVEIWNVESWKKIVRLPVSGGTIWSIEWGPDSNNLVLGFSNGNVVKWDLSAVNDELKKLELNWH